MLQGLLFMIRNGSFGSNYTAKLFFLIFSLLICYYDYKKNKRKDYFWVFLIGTLVWFFVEFSVQILGIRVTDAYMFGLHLPVFLAALLRGAAEGGFIILFGLFFADRFQEKNKKWISIFIILVALTFFLTLAQGHETRTGFDSKRDLLIPIGLIYMGTMVLFDIIWFYFASKKAQKRAFLSFLAMILFTGVWTIGEYMAKTRWIETATGFAPPLIQFLGLSYDVIIEIGLAYVPFLGLAYILKLIKEKKN